MVHSGEVLDLSFLPGSKVDKHSTGGVGDKTSLIIAPIVAAGGLAVPMLSGRGLGHTGGTLDKLESIPGFNVHLSTQQMLRVLSECGCCITGQTAEIAPADKKMYALRDVIGAIESQPLICASIMSKKLAEGIDALVLDVKTGSGAFMKRFEDAEQLAHMLIQAGQSMGVEVAALITDMNEPLGQMIGNALEVKECIEILQGNCSPLNEDLRSLSLEMAAWMFLLGGKAHHLDEGRDLAETLLLQGRALEHFSSMVRLQNGNSEVLTNFELLPRSQYREEIKALRDGYFMVEDCTQIGLASLALGAGRSRKEDQIDFAAGIDLRKKSGSLIQKGEIIALLHYNEERCLPAAHEHFDKSYQVRPEPPKTPRQLIRKILDGKERA